VTEEIGIQATAIVKRFSGVPALSNVTIGLRPGEIVGLVGHNGAGKSTLLRILAGALHPDEGGILVDGRPVEFHGPADALHAGIATVYQELVLLHNLNVVQNLFLGRERAGLGVLRRDAMWHEAKELMERFDLDVDLDQPLGQMPVATRQLIEIAVATHRRARYLMLDEPTSSLEGEQIEDLLERIANLASNEGIGILLVNHKLDELYAVAHHVVALVDGHVTIDGPVDQVSRRDVVRAITGDAVPSEPEAAGSDEPAPRTHDRSHPPDTEPTLTIKSMRTAQVADVSLQAFQGRVLGMYGLIGAGRSETLRTLMGLYKLDGGSVVVLGKPYRPANPAAAHHAGLAYLTEERKLDGLVPQLDSVVNVALPVLRRYARGPLMDHRRMAASSTEILDQLQVRGYRDGPVESLSGGNQQKVLLSRVLAQRPRILLLDEPTKGVDIGVKVEMHRMIRALASEQGLTVVVASSEAEEILQIADEVVIFNGGHCDGRAIPASALTVATLREAAWAGA